MYGVEQAKISDGLATGVMWHPTSESWGRQMKAEAGQKPSASL